MGRAPRARVRGLSPRYSARMQTGSRACGCGRGCGSPAAASLGQPDAAIGPDKGCAVLAAAPSGTSTQVASRSASSPVFCRHCHNTQASTRSDLPIPHRSAFRELLLGISPPLPLLRQLDRPAKLRACSCVAPQGRSEVSELPCLTDGAPPNRAGKCVIEPARVRTGVRLARSGTLPAAVAQIVHRAALSSRRARAEGAYSRGAVPAWIRARQGILAGTVRMRRALPDASKREAPTRQRPRRWVAG